MAIFFLHKASGCCSLDYVLFLVEDVEAGAIWYITGAAPVNCEAKTGGGESRQVGFRYPSWLNVLASQ